eukprot:CAMPEP_0196598554 /NCGR_PEP_ID=MMETSP1081-20130531/94385_1 /TAXON_ID=36882 /ORGANISM="Pyramimonas amylifera, Strain CCMP720" /LENGTH=282 /DNA_ID=CAMNT_0041924263 /DNA_START=178 /DNA_END=1026 /DNA_ORIENTATION=-
MQRLMASLGRGDELGMRYLERPLFSRYLLEGLGLPSLNVSSRLVVFGEIERAEASALKLHEKEIEDLNDVLPQGEFRHRHRTCAVVGNSRRMLTDQSGPFIDSMDAVLRFNEAPTKGFEAHVGKRTTYRAMHYTYLKALITAKSDRTGRKAPTGGKTVVLYGELSVPSYIELIRRYPENLNYIIGPSVRIASKSLHKKVKERMILLGSSSSALKTTYPHFIEAIFLMMQMCAKLHIFGVDAEATNPYFEKKDVLMVTNDIILDPFLMLMLRAMTVEGFVHLH